MNTVTIATAVEPHQVTTVTNNTNARGIVANGNQVQPIMVVANGYSAGVPTLVTNSITGGGRTNLAGPQLEEEDKMERGMTGGEENCMNLLNSSPDEHEPLLRREQPPAESKALPHLPGNILSGRGSNSNNNNNRIALGSEVKIQGADVESGRLNDVEVSRGGGMNCPKPEPQLASQQISGALFAELLSTPQSTGGSKAHQVVCPATALLQGCRDPDCGSIQSSICPASQIQEPAAKTSTLSPEAMDAPGLARENPHAEAPCQEVLPLEVQASESPPESQDSEMTAFSALEPAAQQSPTLDPPTPAVLRSHMGATKTKRPERPCSLDLTL